MFFNNQNQKENIYNIPNALTLLRIVFVFLLAYLIFKGISVIYIVILFIIAMLTDGLDGFIARKLNQKTEFGRKFDMFSDRIFMLGFLSVILIKFSFNGILSPNHLFQILFIIGRDIITVPIGIVLMIFKKRAFPRVKLIGKITTFMQVITFPVIILSTSYPFFNFSIFLAVITGIIGLISTWRYILDIREMMIEDKKQKNDRV